MSDDFTTEDFTISVAGLELRMDLADGQATVSLSGDLGVEAAPSVQEWLTFAIEHSEQGVVVDLEKLASADVAGIGAVRRAAQLARTRGRCFIEVGASDQYRSLADPSSFGAPDEPI